LSQPAQKALEKFPIAITDTIDYVRPVGVAWASGRANLIGEHTDYKEMDEIAGRNPA
jgi:galactokinase